MRFMIVHPDGRQFELDSLDVFRKEYEPQGFAILVQPPSGYDIPETKPKAAAKVKSDVPLVG